jgi:hypothetical protein
MKRRLGMQPCGMHRFDRRSTPGKGREVSTASSARRGEFDGQSLGNMGRWSWPRDVDAKRIDEPLAFAACCVPDDGTSVVMVAGNAFAATVSTAAVRGYDQVHTDGLAPGAQFERTTVINKSGAPEKPQAGGGKTRPGAMTREL